MLHSNSTIVKIDDNVEHAFYLNSLYFREHLRRKSSFLFISFKTITKNYSQIFNIFLKLSCFLYYI